MVDLFPPYRHLVVTRASDRKTFPVRIHSENDNGYMTGHGFFSKVSRSKLGDRGMTFVGPFTAEGDLEVRP